MSGALILQRGLYLDLGRVRLAVAFALAGPHVFHDPAVALWHDQQSAALGCLEDDADVRVAGGVVDEGLPGWDSHGRCSNTLGRERAA